VQHHVKVHECGGNHNLHGGRHAACSRGEGRQCAGAGAGAAASAAGGRAADACLERVEREEGEGNPTAGRDGVRSAWRNARAAGQRRMGRSARRGCSGAAARRLGRGTTSRWLHCPHGEGASAAFKTALLGMPAPALSSSTRDLTDSRVPLHFQFCSSSGGRVAGEERRRRL
jgi:hypothetical protein